MFLIQSSEKLSSGIRNETYLGFSHKIREVNAVVIFNVSEVFQFAIRIEENGERFYSHIAEKIADEHIKRIFKYLAEQEVNHKEYFKSLKSQFDRQEYQTPESYSGEYEAYLKAFVDTRIFDLQKQEKEMLKIDSLVQALEFALQRELDSVLYYQEIKGLVPVQQQEMIDKIIEEERRHFIELRELLREYSDKDISFAG